jgi:hypothetical protein
MRQWLRSIADCGVLRVTFDSESLMAAWENGLVEYRIVAGNEDALDWLLTREGMRELAL